MKLKLYSCLTRTACLMAMFGLTVATCIAQDAPDYKKVIADYIEATGGEMAHKGIESIVAKLTFPWTSSGSSPWQCVQ